MRIITLLVYGVALLWGARPALSQDGFEYSRREMVEQYIVDEGITDQRVIKSLLNTPRHEFVPASQKRYAYYDQALPIGYGQTISPPFIVAYMTEVLEPQPDERVLEIGTGSGYQAAVLSPLVEEVYSIEIVEQLGARARNVLRRLDYDNVHTLVGDGYKGWPEHAPFDKIIVTCSPEKVPQPLIDQLKEGGKMIIPLGERYQQVFYLMEKRDGKLYQKALRPTLFVPMTGQSEDQRRVKPDPLNPVIVNGGFELDENDDGKADGWHYQRRSALIHEGARGGTTFIRFKNIESGREAHILQGMGVDGTKLGTLRLHVSYKADNIKTGLQPYQKPGVVFHLFDESRRTLQSKYYGPWTDADEWQDKTYIIALPVKIREAIIQIGLNGATGTLDLDEISLEKKLR